MDDKPLVIGAGSLKTLADLVDGYQETAGSLMVASAIYDGASVDLCIGVVITGIGYHDRVSEDPVRVQARAILEDKTGLKSVSFHTHCRGTIEYFGKHYSVNLSDQDILEIMRSFVIGERHVLVTPKTCNLYVRRPSGVHQLVQPALRVEDDDSRIVTVHQAFAGLFASAGIPLMYSHTPQE